jgi:hypothetical protein
MGLSRMPSAQTESDSPSVKSSSPAHADLFHGFEKSSGTIVTDLGGKSLLPHIQPFEDDLPHQNTRMDKVHRLFGDYDHDTYERHLKDEAKKELTPERKKEWDDEERSLRKAMLSNPPYIPEMPTHDLVTQRVTQMERDIEDQAAHKMHWSPQQQQEFESQKAELMRNPDGKPGPLVKAFYQQIHKSSLELLSGLHAKDSSAPYLGKVSIQEDLHT